MQLKIHARGYETLPYTRSVNDVGAGFTPAQNDQNPDHHVPRKVPTLYQKETSMKCPTCAIDLVMSERLGIEIDYCPTCRGVWLDRGELDKIIERSLPNRAEAPQAIPQGQIQPQPGRPVEMQREVYRSDDHHGDHHDDHGYSGKHKRKSFLADLFD